MPPLDAEVPFARGELAPDSKPRLLVVDDNATLLLTLRLVLESNGFDVVLAANVNEALKYIGSQEFDVLLSDLHMPQPGDGLTVVSAMRHAQPEAVTLIFSAYPEMSAATKAILEQADEILVKPLSVDTLVQSIRERLTTGAPPVPSAVEDVACILERETLSTIDNWLHSVRLDTEAAFVPLKDEDRCAHLPQLFQDLIFRLRYPLPLGTHALVSAAAAQHGLHRSQQGYTAAMLVEESRMLQVSVFQTLQNNLSKIDFSLLLVGVMSIADEIDSQLAQQMASYISEPASEQMPPRGVHGHSWPPTVPHPPVDIRTRRIEEHSA